MFNQYPDIMTVAEACDTLQMSRNTLYELLRNKDIKAFQVNRIWKIPGEQWRNTAEDNPGYTTQGYSYNRIRSIIPQNRKVLFR